MRLFKKISILVLSILFILLICLLLTDNVSYLDNSVYNFIISFKSDSLTAIAIFFTNIVSIYGVIILLIILFFLDKKKSIYMSISIIVMLLLNNIIKIIIMRHRPVDINLITETGYSFPSAHSMNSVAIFGLLIYYVKNIKLNKIYKCIIISIFSLICIIIPFTRVYLGVHYFTDILAGSLLAIIWLCIYTNYLNKKGI